MSESPTQPDPIVPPPLPQPQWGPVPPPAWAAPPPPAKQRKAWLPWALGALALVLLLGCGGVAMAVVSASADLAKVSDERRERTATSSPKPKPTRAPAPVVEDEPEPEPTENLAAGQTLTVTQGGDTMQVRLANFTSRKSACDDFMPAPESGRFLVVDVSVTVVSGSGSINPLFFTFVTDGGETVNSMSGLFSGCGRPLGSGNDFSAGTKRAGQLVFDVNPVKGQIVYEGGLGSNVLGSWRVG